MLCAGDGPLNKMRDRRLNRLNGLRFRTRIGQRKEMRLHSDQMSMSGALRERWSIGLVYDQLLAAQQYRSLTAIAQLSRAIPLLQTTGAASAQRVAKCLESRSKLGFIRLGKRIEIGHIEPFNDCLRNHCLNVLQFKSDDETETTFSAWRVSQSKRRPNESLGHLRPDKLA